jgi:hypothetical protein
VSGLHGSGGAGTPPVPVTELLDSLLGLFRVGGHWRGGRGGSGSLGPRRPFQVHGVPENDGSDHQIQPAGSVALILKASIAQLARRLRPEWGGGSVFSVAIAVLWKYSQPIGPV